MLKNFKIKLAILTACMSVVGGRTSAENQRDVTKPQGPKIHGVKNISTARKVGIGAGIAILTMLLAGSAFLIIKNSVKSKFKDNNEKVIEQAITRAKENNMDFLRLKPENEKKLRTNIQKFKKLMNNRDFFDKNFIEFSHNKEGGPNPPYTIVKDKAKAEKILLFDTIFNTLKNCLSGNIKLTEFLISGKEGDYFGFDFGNDIKIYLDFTKNKEITIKYLSKQYYCRQYTFRMPEND